MARSYNNATVELQGVIEPGWGTPKAMKVLLDGMEDPVYVPRSQITEQEFTPDGDNKRVVFSVKEWIAKKEGWV